MIIERGDVKDRLSKSYHPTGDGGFEDIPEWKEKYTLPLASKPRSG